MNVTVTGASGFLGAWLVRALAAEGHSTTAIVRDPQAWRLHRAQGVNVVHGRPAEWPQLVAASVPDTLVLLDWDGVDAASRADDARQSANLTRWAEVAAAALAAGATRVVGLGSQAEFGPRTDLMHDDDAPAAHTAYGRAKVAARLLLDDLAGAAGARSVWARVFSVYGPLDNEGVLLAGISDAATLGTPMQLSSGRQAWSYLYAADAARALALLAQHPDAGSACNIAHPSAPPLRGIISAFAGRIGDVTLEFGARADPPGGAQLQAATTRLSALGWQPQVSLDEGLQRTAEWLRGRTVDDPFGAGALPARRATARN